MKQAITTRRIKLNPASNMKPTIANLKKYAFRFGGLVEEDCDVRDMRVLQIVLPDGYLWACDRIPSLVVYWPKRGTEAQKQDVFTDACDRMNYMTVIDPDYDE